MQEQHGGRRGLSQIQYVFVELPKFPLDRAPATVVEEWAYVFRRAEVLTEVPAILRAPGPRGALDAARTAHFTAGEWEAYDRVQMAEQDARGALAFAERKGREQGREEGRGEGEARGEARGRANALLTVLHARGFVLDASVVAKIESCDDLATLDRWLAHAVVVDAIEDVFGAA